MDASSYIKRNHTVRKPVTAIIVAIAVAMLGAMYFVMSGTQRSEFNNNVMNIMSERKNTNNISAETKIKTKTSNAKTSNTKTSTKEIVNESIEQRVLKKREKIRMSLQRKKIQEERDLRRQIKKQEQDYSQKRKTMSRINAPLVSTSNEKKVLKQKSRAIVKIRSNRAPVIEAYSAEHIKALDSGKFMENTSSRNVKPIVEPVNIIDEEVDGLSSSPVTDILLDATMEAAGAITVDAEKTEVEIEEVF